MQTTIPCPGCRTELEPSATVCHICTRPRGKLEITRGFATLREMENQRKRRPFVIAGRVLTAAAVGGLVFRFHAPLLSAASAAQAAAAKFADGLLYPPPPPGSVPIAPMSSIASAPPQVGVIAAPAASAPAAAAAPAPAAPAAKAPRPPARVEDLPLPSIDSSWQWVFYGRVYDLITLQPVADAQLNFSSIGQYRMLGTDSWSSRTDPEGRFAAPLKRLPDGSSYEIHATRAGYTPVVFYESDIPYATLPLADRRDLTRQAQDGDMTLPALTDVAGETSVRRDIFLAPSR